MEPLRVSWSAWFVDEFVLFSWMRVLLDSAAAAAAACSVFLV